MAVAIVAAVIIVVPFLWMCAPAIQDWNMGRRWDTGLGPVGRIIQCAIFLWILFCVFVLPVLLLVKVF